MIVIPWTPDSLRAAIDRHFSARCRAEERAGEIEEEIKLLKAELARCEAISWRHWEAQHRLVDLVRGREAT